MQISILEIQVISYVYLRLAIFDAIRFSDTILVHF